MIILGIILVIVGYVTTIPILETLGVLNIFSIFITVALVAGSVADRMRFSAYLLFSIGWFMFV